jgi:hypothetical protein
MVAQAPVLTKADIRWMSGHVCCRVKQPSASIVPFARGPRRRSLEWHLSA